MKQNYKMKIKIHVQEHFSHVYVKIPIYSETCLIWNVLGKKFCVGIDRVLGCSVKDKTTIEFKWKWKSSWIIQWNRLHRCWIRKVLFYNILIFWNPSWIGFRTRHNIVKSCSQNILVSLKLTVEDIVHMVCHCLKVQGDRGNELGNGSLIFGLFPISLFNKRDMSQQRLMNDSVWYETIAISSWLSQKWSGCNFCHR